MLFCPQALWAFKQHLCFILSLFLFSLSLICCWQRCYVHPQTPGPLLPWKPGLKLPGFFSPLNTNFTNPFVSLSPSDALCSQTRRTKRIKRLVRLDCHLVIYHRPSQTIRELKASIGSTLDSALHPADNPNLSHHMKLSSSRLQSALVSVLETNWISCWKMWIKTAKTNPCVIWS